MIKIKLNGKVTCEQFFQYSMSDDNNLFVIIHQPDYSPGRCHIYFKNGGDYYEEIEHNIPYQSLSWIYNEQKDTTYIIRVVNIKPERTEYAIYRIDINTRLVTQIYYTDQAIRLEFELPFIYELNDNRDLRILCIDQTTNLKETVFSCVRRFKFVKYKGEQLLEIQYLNKEQQYYKVPEFEKVFEYNRKRLSEIKNTLFIRTLNQLEINNYLCRVHYEVDPFNNCCYKFRNHQKFRRHAIWIDQMKNNVLGKGKLLQMRPKSKIFRTFKRTGESYIISIQQLIIHTTKIEQEQYQHFIIDIRNAQEQQILSHYQIMIEGDRLLELRDEEIWIYELGQNDQKLQLQ